MSVSVLCTCVQLYVGFISNLITFPINFLVAFLFKRSRPRRKRASRVAAAVRRMRSRQVASVDDALDRPETPYSDQPLTRPMLHADLQEWGAQRYAEPMEPAIRPSGTSNAEFQDVDPWSDVSNQCDALPAKKKRLSLPWWCSIIAWLLLWMTVGVCAAFVTFYGIMFQDDKCKKWISSMIVSFLTSVLFTQPIKVLLLALFFALIFKKTDDDEEEEELEDEEDPDLGPDEAWLHSSTLAGNSLVIHNAEALQSQRFGVFHVVN